MVEQVIDWIVVARSNRVNHINVPNFDPLHDGVEDTLVPLGKGGPDCPWGRRSNQRDRSRNVAKSRQRIGAQLLRRFDDVVPSGILDACRADRNWLCLNSCGWG
jgi:hypothetical protein